jgi:Domain of unknown function (DUF4091)/Family of unknown function (DUF6067)
LSSYPKCVCALVTAFSRCRSGSQVLSKLAVLATGLFIASGTHLVQGANISAVWANEGGDKVTQDELRVTLKKENLTGKVLNRAWDGKTISLFGAHNEVVSFNLVLEAAFADANNVSVSFDALTGPNGTKIQSSRATGNGVFNWVGRPIELFYTRYLQIHGLSFFGYGKGDERQVPKRFQRPIVDTWHGVGFWEDRPDHDKFYPDILVPLELVPTFKINAGQNQSIWADIYIPKGIPAGTYTGNVTVKENGQTSYTVPVQLNIYGFELPDVPTNKTMSSLNTTDLMWRYVTGYGNYVTPGSADGARVRRITDKYFQLFHRHKVALFGENDCVATDTPCATSKPRFDGTLFTAANGYDGPGVGTPVGVYAVGGWGTWSWRYSNSEQEMWNHTDNYMKWFDANAPANDVFLFLEDEPPAEDIPQIETWSQWLAENPGPGKRMLSMATHHFVHAKDDAPSLQVPVFHADLGACPNGPPCDVPTVDESAANHYRQTPGKRLWAYSDFSPATGTTETEGNGIDWRQLAWTQYKKGIERWFYWNINFVPQTDYFQQAVTWGSPQFFDPVLGWYGWNGTSNGNGILCYPGTDLYNPSDSYNVDGPFASLRLKEWRRGIQDADYLAMAARIDPAATQQIVNRIIPKVLWEYPNDDPSWIISDISWSVDPDVWEAARLQLAQIISGTR